MHSGEDVADPVALRDDVSRALRFLPGARALYAFGSPADGRGDRYSDIDLKLLTDDLQLSLVRRHAVLHHVRPIALEWTIDCTDTSWAATVLFDGVSPFHKLDIDISVIGVDDPVGYPGFERLWEADVRATGTLSALAQPNPPYTPALGGVQHFVLGQLLGVTRYVKARRRGQMFTCWRFVSALIDAMLVLRSMRAFPNGRVEPTLRTDDYLRLDRVVDAAEHDRFFARLDLSSPEAMDATVHQVALEVIALSGELARDAPIPATLISLFTAFFDAELLPG